MAATWSWIGTTSIPTLAANWSLTGGSSAGSVPQAGDTAIFPGGTTVPPQFVNLPLTNTLSLISNGTIEFSNTTTIAANSGLGASNARHQRAAACCIINADRSAIRYRHRRRDDSAERQRLKELARLKLLLDREGMRMNHKRLRRLYAEESLCAPPRRTQACLGHTGAAGAAAGSERALVLGLCRGHADRRAAVPHPCGGG